MMLITRLARHCFTTRAAARRAFPKSSLAALQQAIASGEQQHRAQVRMVVETALPMLAVMENQSARQRARELFSEYQVWDTEENCGVLLYINLADRKVEIIADRGVDGVIGKTAWQAVCHKMVHGFAHGAYHESALAGIKHLNTLLATHFPPQPGRSNELPDAPVMR